MALGQRHGGAQREGPQGVRVAHDGDAEEADVARISHLLQPGQEARREKVPQLHLWGGRGAYSTAMGRMVQQGYGGRMEQQVYGGRLEQQGYGGRME